MSEVTKYNSLKVKIDVLEQRLEKMRDEYNQDVADLWEYREDLCETIQKLTGELERVYLFLPYAEKYLTMVERKTPFVGLELEKVRELIENHRASKK